MTAATPKEYAEAFQTDLAATVSGRLKDSGFTYRAVSDATGIPLSTLHRRLAGTHGFYLGEMARIAHLLGTNITAIVREAEAA